MKDLGNDVRNMFLNLASNEKNFFGGVPYSEDLDREIRNYEKYFSGEMPSRKRICMGMIFFGDKKNILGYTSFTIMNNSPPTSYEKEFIGLKENLNYLQLKKLFVHPLHRKKGIGSKLIEDRLEIAMTFEKDVVCDVKKENKKIISLLKSKGLLESFYWKTSKGTEMIRLEKLF